MAVFKSFDYDGFNNFFSLITTTVQVSYFFGYIMTHRIDQKIHVYSSFDINDWLHRARTQSRKSLVKKSQSICTAD